MEVGHLERVERPNKPVVYLGEIMLGRVSGDICLVPAKVKRTDQSPDFEVKLRQHGTPAWVASGAAWRKPSKDRTGFYFSVTVDGPDFVKPYYVAAFADDEQPKDTAKDKPVFFTVKWGRPRGGGQAPAAGERQSVDDEIPY